MGQRNLGNGGVVVSGNISMHGRLKLTVVKPDGSIRQEVEGDNVMCVNGVTAIAAALVWSGIQDQATNLGVTSTYLTPLYGAVGNGAATPANTDTQLVAELGRVTVGAGASVPSTTTLPGQVTWLFYFSQPSVTWTITEAGVFADASSTVNSGIMLDHYAVSPNVTVPTTDTLILQASFSITGQ